MLLAAFILAPQVPSTTAEILIDGKPQRIASFHGMNLQIETGGALSLRYIVEQKDDQIKRLVPKPLWRNLVAKSEATTERFSFPVIRVAITLEDGRYVVVDRDRHLAVLPKGSLDLYWWKGPTRKLTEPQAEELMATMRAWK